MKKLIALLLCLVMALSLVACGSKQDDTQAPADDQQGAEETSLVDAAALIRYPMRTREDIFYQNAPGTES